MKFAILALGFLLAMPNLFAQLHPAEGLPSMRETTPPVVLLTGKVLTDANTPAPERVTVALNCGGTTSVAQTQSDGKGFFSVSVALSDGRSTLVSPQNGASMSSTSQLESCELVADVNGYTAEPLRINPSGDMGVINVGTIVLRSTAPKHGFTVSAISLAAPDKAKNAFAKGEEQKNKGKWSAAIASFRRAIAAYPRFALAWLELGRVQARQNDFADARQSFQESVTRDSRLVDGYVELAHLAAKQQEWQDLATVTDHLTQIHPDEPEYWFLNSVAYFNLGNIRQADTSITRGMRLDLSHHIPQMEYLYALILARNQNYESAVDHVSTYLKLAPQAADAQNAQKLLRELQQRSSQTSAAK